MKRKHQVEPVIVRSTAGLRNKMFEEVEAMLAGRGDPQRINLLTRATATILRTLDAEVKYHRFVSTTPQINGQQKAIDFSGG
jgi:hypothetical protein